MFKVKSIDILKFPTGKLFVIRTPIDGYKRTQSDAIEAIGTEIEIDNIIYKIKGIEMFMPNIPMRKNENIGVLVDETSN